MKKILLSAGMIIFIGTIAAGATGAFFSDTETSIGNVFTAGAIDLTVDSTQHYNNAICDLQTKTWQLFGTSTPAIDQYPVIGSPCDGTWLATNLGPNFHFFNFGDVKPGDQGEDTVSLHVDNNPAYACVDIGTNSNNENTLIDPEIKVGDTSSTTGELAQNVHVFAWLDNASTSTAVPGDNIWQPNETVLQPPVALSGLNATTTLTLADGGTGTPLPGGSTSFIGLGWCAGTIHIVSPGNWTCDGSTMGNDTQTDSASSTIQFRVTQARNNSGFRCATSTPVIS